MNFDDKSEGSDDILLEELLDTISESGICVADFSTGKVIYVAESVCSVFGYTKEEILDGGIEFWPSITHKEDYPKSMAVFTKWMEDIASPDSIFRQLPMSTIIHRLMHKNGEYLWIANSNVVLNFAEAGTPKYVLVIFRKIELEEYQKFHLYSKEAKLIELPLNFKEAIQISEREKEVLVLIGDGLSARKIADQLNISAYTVIGHTKHLKEKFDVKNVAQLIKEATKSFWLK